MSETQFTHKISFRHSSTSFIFTVIGPDGATEFEYHLADEMHRVEIHWAHDDGIGLKSEGPCDLLHKTCWHDAGYAAATRYAEALIEDGEEAIWGGLESWYEERLAAWQEHAAKVARTPEQVAIYYWHEGQDFEPGKIYCERVDDVSTEEPHQFPIWFFTVDGIGKTYFGSLDELRAETGL